MGMSFSRRVGRIRISETKLMPMIAAEVGGCVSLGQGVPSFATPEHVTDAVCRALREDHAAGKYSLQPGMPALREAVAELLTREKGLRVDPRAEVAITVGAMEAPMPRTWSRCCSRAGCRFRCPPGRAGGWTWRPWRRR